MIDLSLADENQIKQLAEENSRLKKQVAELSLDKTVLQDVLAKNWDCPRRWLSLGPPDP
jgi:putative transposase